MIPPRAAQPSRHLSPRWLARRRRLHAAFLSHCEPPDASWLAHLGRPGRQRSAAEVRELWAAVPRQPHAINHVYVHVPFCKSICSFCNYERLRPSHPEQLSAWRDRVLASIAALAPGLSGLTFHTLYFGGGTPSVLPAEHLEDVVGALEQAVHFHPHASRYFEMDPAVMTPRRLSAWKSLGFSHVSFGIQTLSGAVNLDHNRGAQDRELVDRRFVELREAGVEEVSCDFLFGLAGTTVEDILAEIHSVMSTHRPRWVDIYQLTPTPEYVASHFGGERERFWAHLAPFQAQGPAGLRRIAEELRYDLHVGQDHRYTLQKCNEHIPDRPPPAHVPFSYSQLIADQQQPLSLLGLGPSARSRIFGGGWLHCEEPEEAGGPAVWQGCAVDLYEEARCYLIYSLRDGSRIARARFAEIFGHSLEESAAVPIAALIAEGRAQMDEDALVMVSADRRQRTADLLWLVEETRLERELARALGISLDARTLWHLLHPLHPGAVLSGFTLAGVGRARIRLRGEGGEVLLRVCPPVMAHGGLELVVESAPPLQGEARRALRRAVGGLKRMLSAGSHIA